MRPLLQYDLDEPQTTSSVPGLLPAGPYPSNARRPPTKKRKRNYHNAQRPASGTSQKTKVSVQHWDDPGSAAVGVVYDDEGSTSIDAGSAAVSYAEGADIYDGVDEGADVDIYAEQGEELEEEESRPLTHEEIWDDSALIDAWNSAQAEYQAYHGLSKDWKTEPVKKSPLWYNKPYVAPPSKPKPHPPQAPPHEDGGPEPDTAPLDFDTFVPTHDPSLASASTAPASTHASAAPFFVPPPSAMTVSRDEAFSNALSAMYWSGYWTAVYHCQSQASGRSDDEPAEGTEGDGVGADESEGEYQDLVPTQR